MTLGIEGLSPLTFVFLLLLSIASVIDLRSHRIPNLLTACILALGLGWHIAVHGLSGLQVSVLGTITGLIVFLPFYVKKVMGAGDVKLMAAVGSFVGVPQIFGAVCATLICGGLFALIVFAVHGGIADFLTRYYRMLRTFSGTFQWVYEPAPAVSTATRKFPYAIAIASGTFLSLYFAETLTVI